MPELPEVETVRRALLPHVAGRCVESIQCRVPRLRTPLDSATLHACLPGQTFRDIRRFGKFLVFATNGPHGLLAHLGMTGAFRTALPCAPPEPYERVAIHFTDRTSLRFDDVRKFGTLAICELRNHSPCPAELAHLGPDPFSSRFSADYLRSRFHTSVRPVKNALLDQTLVAGIGNIYASESLFRAQISPVRACSRISAHRCARLVEAVRAVLTQAIQMGGTTIRDYSSLNGNEGKFRIQLRVYGHADSPCPRCGPRHPVRRVVQAGRSTFYCPNCQQ